MKIKFLVITAVLATAILCSGGAVKAQGLTIAQLMAQIQQLQAQLELLRQLPAGCTSSNGYSPTTGLPCGSTPVYPAGCTSALGYSSTTGQDCSCTSASGYSLNTGAPCGSTQPSITITSPNGGEQLQVGSTYNITWQSAGLSTGANVIINLSNSGKSTIYYIANVPASLGTYSWTIPATISGNDIIGSQSKIIIADNTDNISGLSNNYFSIVTPTPTPILPAGCTSTSGYSATTGVNCNGCTSTSGYSPTTGASCNIIVAPTCQNLYWHDSNSTSCGYKQFCGAYMYNSLKTFNTLDICQADLNPSAGCTSTSGYNSMTGQPCGSTPVYPMDNGCTSNSGYSATTGLPCGNYTAPTLPAGCTSTSGYSATTGVNCNGCTSTSGYSPTTGQSCGNGT